MDDAGSSGSLDPGDWRSLRALGHRMLDDLFDDLEAVRGGAVWRPMTEAVRAAWREALPRAGADPEHVYADWAAAIVRETKIRRADGCRAYGAVGVFASRSRTSQ